MRARFFRTHSLFFICYLALFACTSDGSKNQLSEITKDDLDSDNDEFNNLENNNESNEGVKEPNSLFQNENNIQNWQRTGEYKKIFDKYTKQWTYVEILKPAYKLWWIGYNYQEKKGLVRIEVITLGGHTQFYQEKS